MGNACGCGDDDYKKDAALDKYIKTHHMWKYPHKCPKLDKVSLAQQKALDFAPEERVFRSSVHHEILDDNAKRQDMQAPDSIN